MCEHDPLTGVILGTRRAGVSIVRDLVEAASKASRNNFGEKTNNHIHTFYFFIFMFLYSCLFAGFPTVFCSVPCLT